MVLSLQLDKHHQTHGEILIPLLARRSCHLPGNNWREDWMQWFRNNHILLGICLHHPLHPLEGWERTLALAASVSFGLVATNVIYQLDRYDHDLMITPLVSYAGYSITHAMVLLWTLGGVCHGFFDMITWHIMACACCHQGGRWGDMPTSRRYKDCGSYLLIPVVLGLLSLAAYMVLLRAALVSTENDISNSYYNGNGQVEQQSIVSDIDSIDSFSFLTKYGIELVLAWFLYFPLVGTVLFSGIFGCNGALPILGGRPRDMKLIHSARYGMHLRSPANYNKV